jgi:hypothetical protein
MSESGDRRVPSLLSQEKRRYRRAFWTGLGISAVVHGGFFLWTAGQVRFGAARFETPPPSVAPPQGIQVIEVRPLTPEEAEAREEQRLIELRQTEPETPLAGEEAPGGEPLPPVPPSAGGEQGRGLTNAEKLQPRIGDRNLWRDYEPENRAEYLSERMPQAEAALRSYLGRMLDSLNLSEEQRRKAVEWLMGDDEDWGITPDGIVLGGVEIPMNVGAMFNEEGPRGRESRQLQRDQDLIDQQELRSDIEATLEERNRAMEDRADSARARADSSAAADSVSGPP